MYNVFIGCFWDAEVSSLATSSFLSRVRRRGVLISSQFATGSWGSQLLIYLVISNFFIIMRGFACWRRIYLCPRSTHPSPRASVLASTLVQEERLRSSDAHAPNLRPHTRPHTTSDDGRCRKATQAIRTIVRHISVTWTSDERRDVRWDVRRDVRRSVQYALIGACAHIAGVRCMLHMYGVCA